jgi:hypothetical protein
MAPSACSASSRSRIEPPPPGCSMRERCGTASSSRCAGPRCWNSTAGVIPPSWTRWQRRSRRERPPSANSMSGYRILISRATCWRAPKTRCACLRSRGCGWSDLGTPQRVAECVRRCDASLTARQQVRPGVVTLATAHLRSVAEMGVWGATEPMLVDRWSITQPRTGAEGVTLL